MRVMILGEKQSGKTAIIQKFKYGEIIPATTNIQTIEYKNTHLILLDVQNTDLTILTQFTKVDAVIIVIDSTASDYTIWNKNITDFFKTPTHPVYSKPLLVYANKQDLPSAQTLTTISEKLELYTISLHPWFIQSACALTGDGLYEGLDFLVNAYKEEKPRISF